MGRIVLTEFTYIDGVVEAPGGEDFKYPNWTFEFDRGPEGERFKEAESLQAAALLLGRRTYEGFAAAWPRYEGELADKYNSMPKYVVSHTLTDPKWAGTTVLNGDLAQDVTRLKQRLEAKGWIVAEWGVSENNRKARFYKLTPSGREQLVREADQWRRLVQAMGRVLGPEEA